jgi:hypothetical protein
MELGREGMRCGEGRGSHRHFIGARGAPERGGWGRVTAALMALTPLKTGVRLRGGLRGGNDGGASNGSGDIRGWSWAARGGRRRRGEAATIGRRGEGDGADRRAPHGSDVRERRRLYRSVQRRREYAFHQICQRGLGRVGSRRLAGRSGPAWVELCRMGQNPKKIPFRIKIKFLNIPRL